MLLVPFQVPHFWLHVVMTTYSTGQLLQQADFDTSIVTLCGKTLPALKNFYGAVNVAVAVSVLVEPCDSRQGHYD